MDLGYDAAYTAFREEVRAFLARHWPPGSERKDRERVRAFRRLATERGYLYRAIPKRYGGSEQAPDVLKAQIIREEFTRAGAPREVGGNGVMMLVPTLLAHGEEWQKERFIAPTLSGEYVWAQGYSEPGAGSDLASLTTRAVLDGDEWVITGHKVWTTDAQRANYMFALVRTEPEAPKHEGITYMLIDMDQPGIVVRPLKQITGTAEFNEIFIDEARTPKDWIVGGRGQGWKISRSTLRFERNAVGSSESSLALFDKLVALAKTTPLNGRPAIEDPEVRAALGRIEGYVLAHKYAGWYQLTCEAEGREAGAISVMNKQILTNIAQRIALVAQHIMAESALLMPEYGSGHRPGPERWVQQYFNSLAAAIGGGTSNIQRNIVAERVLGLPRDQARGGAS